jgi:hypothetical protein
LFGYEKFATNTKRAVYDSVVAAVQIYWLPTDGDAMPKKYRRQPLAGAQTVSEWINHSIVKLE